MRRSCTSMSSRLQPPVGGVGGCEQHWTGQPAPSEQGRPIEAGMGWWPEASSATGREAGKALQLAVAGSCGLDGAEVQVHLPWWTA